MKYFTIATEATPPKRYSWDYRRRNRTHSDDVVLVFGADNDEELTLDDLDLIAADQHVQKIMQKPFIAHFIGTKSGDQILVHQALDLMPLPNTAPLDAPPVLLCREGQAPVEIDPRRLFDSCTSLFRAIGCANCPDRLTTCISHVYGENPFFLELKSAAYFPDLRETLKNRKMEIAGFTYISPMLTRVDVHYDHFAPFQRSWGEHDFTQVAAWAKQRSKANAAGAEHHSFKKKQCTKCPLKEHCQFTYRSRHCEGPFPAEEEIDAQLLEVYARFEHSTELEPWQFNVIAQMAGAEGMIGRRSCILDGFVRKPRDVLTIQAHRNKTRTDLQKEWPATKLDYENIAVYFDLPKTESEAKAQLKEVTGGAKAMWAASLGSTHVSARSSGWGYHQDEIGYRKLCPYYIEIGVRGPREVWTGRTIRTWNDYADSIGDPPISQNKVR